GDLHELHTVSVLRGAPPRTAVTPLLLSSHVAVAILVRPHSCGAKARAPCCLSWAASSEPASNLIDAYARHRDGQRDACHRTRAGPRQHSRNRLTNLPRLSAVHLRLRLLSERARVGELGARSTAGRRADPRHDAADRQRRDRIHVDLYWPRAHRRHW